MGGGGGDGGSHPGIAAAGFNARVRAFNGGNLRRTIRGGPAATAPPPPPRRPRLHRASGFNGIYFRPYLLSTLDRHRRATIRTVSYVARDGAFAPRTSNGAAFNGAFACTRASMRHGKSARENPRPSTTRRIVSHRGGEQKYIPLPAKTYARVVPRIPNKNKRSGSNTTAARNCRASWHFQ